MSTLKVPLHEGDHILGNKNAPIIMIEYGDYQCPVCGQAFPITKQIQKHYGKDLEFVFRHFPLTQVHPFAEVAAETAEFAGAHNKYWEMHDLIYENQEQLGIPLLLELTQTLNLSEAALQLALERGTYRGKVKSDFLSGIRSGVPGTPTFFINENKISGFYEYEDLIDIIDKLRG